MGFYEVKALYAQKPLPSLGAGRHFEKMTKTRRAESVIVNLGQTYNSRKPTDQRAVARTLTPTGARQLIGCTGSIVFKSRR